MVCRELTLPTLKYQPAREDMIEEYKILNNKYDSRVNLYLEQFQNNKTRGHDLKLINRSCHCDLRIVQSFTVRVTNIWNSLHESVISAETIDTFKNWLDIFRKNQDMVYDYKCDLTGSLTNMDESLTDCA